MGTVAVPSAGCFDAGPPGASAVADAWHPADVHLMLVRHARLLFVRRAASGLWVLPCTGLSPDETVVDGACRTALEQLTVYVERSDVRLSHVQRHENGGGIRLVLLAQARTFRGIPVVTDRRVLDRLAWCRPTRIPEPADPKVVAAVSAWDRRTLFSGDGTVPGGDPCGQMGSTAGNVAGHDEFIQG